MLFSKFQSSLVLMSISGIILIILIYFIVNQAEKEGFKCRNIFYEDGLKKKKTRANSRQIEKGKSKINSTIQKIKNNLHNMIINDKEFIEEVAEVINDKTLSSELDKEPNSQKIILNRVSEVLSTPKITDQISDVIKNNPEFKKNTKSVKENKVAQSQLNMDKDDDKETPYDRIMSAHNKLSDKNDMVIEKKLRDLEEINSIRKEIDRIGETQRLNQQAAAALEVEIKKVHNAHTKAEKDLKEQTVIFKELVKRNLATYNRLGKLTANVARSKNKCQKQSSEVKRLKVRIESVNSEKRSAEDNLKDLNEQLTAVNSNESISNVLKAQIKKMEKQKEEIEKNLSALSEDLKIEMKKEESLQSDILSNELDIKQLKQENLKLEKKIADLTAKNKLENDAFSALNKEIDDAKVRLGVRNSTNILLDNELRNLKKQYDALMVSESQEEMLLKELEKENSKNKQTINDLQTMVKLLQPPKPPILVNNPLGPSWSQKTVNSALVPDTISIGMSISAGVSPFPEGIPFTTNNSGTYDADRKYYLGDVVCHISQAYLCLGWNKDPRGPAYQAVYKQTPGIDAFAWKPVNSIGVC
jgi:chromosome segregation ATPase